MNVTAWLAALLIGVLALWRIDSIGSDLELANVNAANVAEQLAASNTRAEEQATVIADQREALKKSTDADRTYRALLQTIDKDGTATRAALQELKENDQAVADYLLGAVPAAYGVQFARPETIDPTSYKPGVGVPAGGMRAASSAGGTEQQPVGTGAAEH